MKKIPRRFIHKSHPLLVLKNLFIKRDSNLIPEGQYCYKRISYTTSKDGYVVSGKVEACSYFEEYTSNRHALSPLDGFCGCKYMNRYDDPCINDMVKVCNENIGDEQETEDGL